MPQESKYQFEIWTPDGTLLADFSGMARNRNFKLTRNRTYEASFSLELNHLQDYADRTNVLASTLLGVGFNELRIKRGNRYVFGGQIANYSTDFGNEEKVISVRAFGFLELFASRFTDSEKIYTATDAGLIAKDLIDDSQVLTNGNVGVVTNAAYVQATQLRDRVYPMDKNIKEALVELSQVIGGFDFEFTYDKKFYVYTEMGVQRSEFEFTYPGNIKKLKVSTDASKLVNQAIVRGAGTDDSQLRTVRSALTEQAFYKLRQGIVDASDVSVLTTLEQKGDEFVRINATPPDLLDITIDGNQEPVIGSYWLGDRIKVKVNGVKLYSRINSYYKIDEISVRIDDEDSEEITLKASSI